MNLTPEHQHDHAHGGEINQGNMKVFLVGIVLNILFVIAEAVAGLMYNSMALLTDAGHNLSDVAGLSISVVAFWMAKKQSNPTFTYGYKKITVLAALVNAVVLLIAIGVLGFESVTRLLNPMPVSGGVIAWVAALGIVVNGVSAFLFFRQKQELNSRSAYLHLLGDTLVSAGVVVTGIIISGTRWYWLDPAVSLTVMIVILISTWGLLRDGFKMTIDAVPAGIELHAIKQVILAVPHVMHVHHVHVWALSTTENALTAHVIMDQELSFEKKLEVVNQIKHALQHHNIQHSTIELSQQSET